MDDLKRVLQKILKATPNYEATVERNQVVDQWETIVGERVAKHCWPVKLFDDGILIIAAESNSWLQSLRYLEPQILQKYEKALGSKKVKGLRFRLQHKS
jgi:predicted nucleic acid-binding Zn ribbon protein